MYCWYFFGMPVPIALRSEILVQARKNCPGCPNGSARIEIVSGNREWSQELGGQCRRASTAAGHARVDVEAWRFIVQEIGVGSASVEVSHFF